MGNYKMVVMNRPRDGQDEALNHWFDTQHIGDVLAVPGITSAQRFRQVGAPVGAQAWPYYTVYEIDHDDPQQVVGELLARMSSDAMPMSDAIDPDGYCVLYEAIGPRRLADREGQDKAL